MPHKHKRKRDDDKSGFNLAPTTRARPLPAYKVPSIFTSDKDGPSNKRRKPNSSGGKPNLQDDTPKQFARMMAWQAAGKIPSGLDNGDPKPKTKKQSKITTNSATASAEVAAPVSASQAKSNPTTQPKILPGESLSSFSLRVNQSLPLKSMPQISAAPSTIPSDIKPRAPLTKHNRRLQKLISSWRETDAKLKSKAEEDESDYSGADSAVEEEDSLWNSVRAARVDRKGKKKNSKVGKKDDDDPWKQLEKKKRRETRQKSLQDVVQAPPELKAVKSKFKTREEDFEGVDRRLGNKKRVADVGADVRDVPGRAGSLRRREQLGGVRREVIEGYRKMVGRKGRQGVGFPKAIPA